MPQLLAEHLALLSRTAVRRAAALAAVGVSEAALATVLYRAGGVGPRPGLDDRWARYLLDRADRSAGTTRHRRSQSEHWSAWTALGCSVEGLQHKVYVSPAVGGLRDALPVAVRLAVEADVLAWKIGADVAGLHRPDKMVLYASTRSEADAVATALADALAGVPAQGVPFTGQVGATGMVSRGQDFGGLSWRAVICRQLAVALAVAAAEPAFGGHAGAIADTALEHLRSRGVDVDGWRPSGSERLLAEEMTAMRAACAA